MPCDFFFILPGLLQRFVDSFRAMGALCFLSLISGPPATFCQFAQSSGFLALRGTALAPRGTALKLRGTALTLSISISWFTARDLA